MTLNNATKRQILIFIKNGGGKNCLNGKDIGDAIIGKNCNLNIRAIDSVNLKDGFIVGSYGNVHIICDGFIELDGISVEANGCMNLNGQNIILNKGITIEKGAILKLNGSK